MSGLCCEQSRRLTMTLHGSQLHWRFSGSLISFCPFCGQALPRVDTRPQKDDLALSRWQQLATNSQVPRIGEIYQHYKTRHLYWVLSLALHEVDLEPAVVYVNQDLQIPWVRDLTSFQESVVCQENPGQMTRRFVQKPSAEHDLFAGVRQNGTVEELRDLNRSLQGLLRAVMAEKQSLCKECALLKGRMEDLAGEFPDADNLPRLADLAPGFGGPSLGADAAEALGGPGTGNGTTPVV